MEPIDYIVESLAGDYAYLKRIDKEDAELKCVARALLPEAVREGSRLHYEMLEYRIKSAIHLINSYSKQQNIFNKFM